MEYDNFVLYHSQSVLEQCYSPLLLILVETTNTFIGVNPIELSRKYFLVNMYIYTPVLHILRFLLCQANSCHLCSLIRS